MDEQKQEPEYGLGQKTSGWAVVGIIAFLALALIMRYYVTGSWFSNNPYPGL